MNDLSNLRAVTLQRLGTSNVWWKKNININDSIAESCRQAVTVRNRLGSNSTEGVPLWSEIKSEIGYVSDDKRKILYVSHTRANTEIDEKKVKLIFGFDPETSSINRLLSGEDDKDRVSSPYFGLVNPFNADEIAKALGHPSQKLTVFQVLDNSLFLNAGFPNTLLTNLGSKTESLEIHASDLLAILRDNFRNVEVGDISNPCHIWLGNGIKHGNKYEWMRFPPPTGPKIGILTGNSPESGMDLWHDILTIFRKIYLQRASDSGMPEVIVHSLPAMGLSMELIDREELVWKHMEKAIINLLEAGCKLITVACNTTIYFEDHIGSMCTKYDAEFVSIATSCLPGILTVVKDKQGSNKRKIGLIGIGPVIDKGKYSRYRKVLEDENIVVHEFLGEELAYLMKRIGTNTEETKAAVRKFSHILRNEFEEDEVIVLALTEVSLMYREYKETIKEKYQVSNIVIDPMKELAKAIVEKYIIKGAKESLVMQTSNLEGLEDSISLKVALTD